MPDNITAGVNRMCNKRVFIKLFDANCIDMDENTDETREHEEIVAKTSALYAEPFKFCCVWTTQE